METFEEQPPQYQVFINFRGKDLLNALVSHLVWHLKSNNINVFMDNHEVRGEPLDVLLERIKESKIALVIFSKHYTESEWCLTELEKIKDCSDEGTLMVIPIFYELKPSTVRNLEGKFGYVFRSLAKGEERKKKWKEAFNSITNMIGFTIHEGSNQSRVCLEIVEEVKKLLNNTPPEGSQMATVEPSGNSNVGASSGR